MPNELADLEIQEDADVSFMLEFSFLAKSACSYRIPSAFPISVS